MKTLLKIVAIAVVVLLFGTCNSKDYGNDFTVLSVNIDENAALPMSEIAENIQAIELELTDESLIRSHVILRVIVDGEHIFVAENRKIMLFDSNGKFIRQIGSIGQGPGEFVSVSDIAVDSKNKLIYISTSIKKKILCYDYEGKFIKESPNDFIESNSTSNYIYFFDNELMILSETYKKSEDGLINSISLLKLDQDFVISKRIHIREQKIVAYWTNPLYSNVLSRDGKNDEYLYFYDTSPTLFVPDTLYQLKDDRLTSNLKLEFNHPTISGEKKNVYLMNICKSQRYVYTYYMYDPNSSYYQYIYDTKTGKGYNSKIGLTDDIHTGETFAIRPLANTSENFFYLHTNMNDDATEEPNPTLYIGTLKQ